MGPHARYFGEWFLVTIVTNAVWFGLIISLANGVSGGGGTILAVGGIGSAAMTGYWLFSFVEALIYDIMESQG